MLLQLKKLLSFYTNSKNEAFPEPYQHLPLTGSIIPIILIDLAYYLFVFHIGPRLMRNRQPYNLRKILMFYNIFQIVYNLYVGAMSSYVLLAHKNPRIGCHLQFPNNHAMKGYEILLSYAYHLNKFIDYTETIFFVLRKSFKQITFLHVYHHVLMTTSTYFYTRNHGPGGHSAMVGACNCFVHVVMYIYYLMSSLRPELRQSIWWKKHITEIQIIQFIIIFIHQIWPLVIDVNCPFPKIWIVLSASQAITMIYLFSNFYKNAYLNKSKLKSKSSVGRDRVKSS